MGFSMKWMTLPILATAALGATFAFGGCSVTSGTVDNKEGGTTTPPPGTPPPPPPPGGDGGEVCQGNGENTQSKTDFGPDCQACLEQSCCTELKNCFNLPPGQLDGGTTGVDCNVYADCITKCN